MNKLRVLDLFSGIGGFSLGLERAGMRTVAFCEIDPYCRAVLRKHWPDVPIYEDVRELGTVECDVICGGFPCQDISVAGKGAGLDGVQSSLWTEYRRLIGEIRPSYVIVENVAALLGRGLGRVLGDLAAFGFDAEWHCIPAAAVGAPHLRDRIWVVAHPASSDAWSDAAQPESEESAGGQSPQLLPHAGGSSGSYPARSDNEDVAYADRIAPFGTAISRKELDPWPAEPNVGRVANGVPARMDRIRCLGNSIVPQIAELIGRAIIEAEGLT